MASAPEVQLPLSVSEFLCLSIWGFHRPWACALLGALRAHSPLGSPSSAQKLAKGQCLSHVDYPSPPYVDVGVPGISQMGLECSWIPCGLLHASSSSSIRLETRGPAGLSKPKSGVLTANTQAPLVPDSELWELMNNMDSWAHPELQSWTLSGKGKSPRGVGIITLEHERGWAPEPLTCFHTCKEVALVSK